MITCHCVDCCKTNCQQHVLHNVAETPHSIPYPEHPLAQCATAPAQATAPTHATAPAQATAPQVPEDYVVDGEPREDVGVENTDNS